MTFLVYLKQTERACETIGVISHKHICVAANWTDNRMRLRYQNCHYTVVAPTDGHNGFIKYSSALADGNCLIQFRFCLEPIIAISWTGICVYLHAFQKIPSDSNRKKTHKAAKILIYYWRITLSRVYAKKLKITLV